MYSILLSAGWPIWPLLIISILGLAIAIERACYLRQVNILPKATLEAAFSLANQLSMQKSIAILLIEHDVSLVMGICDNLTVLDYGKVIATGKPADVRTHPEVIRAYLGQGAV